MPLEMALSIVQENPRTLIFQVVYCIHIDIKESGWLLFHQINAFFLVLVCMLHVL